MAGRTALHCAVDSRQLDVVRLLIERGADPKIKDANEMSVLHRAVDKGYEDIVLLLIEKGVDPNT
jgi:ankyrin repeat protein